MAALALKLNSSLAVRSDHYTVTEELLTEFYSHIDASPKTKETYKRGIDAFIAWISRNSIDAVTLETITDFKIYCTNNKSANTANTYLTAVKALYRYLEGRGFRNVAKTVKRVRTDKNHFTKDALTREQVRQILDSINAESLEGLRARALFMLLVNTGLRECEAAGADINDIGSKDNKTVLYIQGKGETQKNAFVVLNGSTVKALTAYLTARGAAAGQPLFTSFSDRNAGQRISTRTIRAIIKGLFADAGIISDRITTHSTRHTFVTLTLKSGVSLQEAQQRARHKDINTTLIYAHNLKLTESNAEQMLEAYLEA